MAKLYSLAILVVLSLLLVTDCTAFIQRLRKAARSVLPVGSIGSAIMDAPRKIGEVIPGAGSAILKVPKKVIGGIVSGAEKEVCYPRLGCFSMSNPWISLMRPLPAPWDPDYISPTTMLFTRGSDSPYNISLNASHWSLEDSDYDPNRVKTVFITHGFASSGEAEWLHKMKNAYLKNVDANVFIVDWGKGASITNYLQVASNTRIVGAELARFAWHLIDNGLMTENIHLIGHSLGSHIMSYCAKNLTVNSHVGRLTALDPAQPGFEGNPSIVRLDAKDALEVDVIHTDAKPFLPFFGFGMMSPHGTVDFYMNGGSSQPGCLQISKPNITSISDLLKYPVEVISEWIGCSHGRSYEYFTSALETENCIFCGRKMSSTETFLKIGTLGALKLPEPLVKDLSSCSRDTCTFLGLDTFKYPARGSFAVTTGSEHPYCDPETPAKTLERERI